MANARRAIQTHLTIRRRLLCITGPHGSETYREYGPYRLTVPVTTNLIENFFYINRRPWQIVTR